MALKLEQTSEEGVTVVTFLDKRIADEPDIIQFGEELTEVVNGEHQKVLLNFEAIEFLSSAAIGKLVMVHKKAGAASVDLKFCSINKPNPFDGFKICNLDTVFDIKESKAEALTSFG